ncbi:MAG: circadian clock KaiB family protein [Mucilaginibacter polytrichastri]|nr:circadian clock KaiB family protein [Mucilaginibacter polytrichastri]
MADADTIIDSENSLHYRLRLYIAGSSPISVRAISNLRIILDTYLPEKYELKVIDIHQSPELTREEDISAVPMLVKSVPVPKRILVGDMSNTAKVLRGLNLD